MLHKLLAATALNSPYGYLSKCNAQWKRGSRLTDRLTDTPQPVHSLHPCLLSNRFWSNTLYVRGRRCVPSCLQQLTDSVEELEVATDSEDVACRGGRFHISRTRRNMRENSGTCNGNNSQESREMMRDLKMFMFGSNYELHKVRRSNIFICHSGVLKSTV